VPEAILTALKLLLLALLYLFFFRVLRAVWVETAAAEPAATTTVPPAGRGAKGSSAHSGSAPARLKVVAPDTAKGRTYELGDEVTVGRATGCQVSLPDDTTVSQLHARVFRKDGRLMVEDLGSTNGTFLNRKRVTGTHSLRKGDRIQVGSTVLEVTR
jgi:pSer/pThr/pTyr-binding forkhead associated (FHA) protein